MIEKDNKISVNRQCVLLNVSSSRVYYKKKEAVDAYQEVKIFMRVIWMKMPARGARYIRAELRKEGFFHSRKKVSALMKEIGIYAVRPKPNLSKAAKKHKKYPCLLRGSLREYFHLYNYERGHQSLGEMTLDEVCNEQYYEAIS